MSGRQTRQRARTAQDDFEYPIRRMAHRGDRWSVRRSPRGTWLAGPKAINVFVDPACLRRYFEFRTHADAIAFAMNRVRSRR